MEKISEHNLLLLLTTPTKKTLLRKGSRVILHIETDDTFYNFEALCIDQNEAKKFLTKCIATLNY